MTIVGPQTEGAVVAVARARVAEGGDLPAVGDVAPDVDADRVERIPDQVGELMGAYREGRLSAAVVFPQVEALEAELAELQARRARLAEEAARPVVSSVDDFDGLGVDRQRAILEALFEAVVVAPAGRRGEPWSVRRLEFVWRAGA